MKYLSLFSGIGGFELGINQAYVHLPKTKRGQQGRLEVSKRSPLPKQKSVGAQPLCVGFSEIDRYAIQIYQKQFPEHKNYGDITKISTNALPDFDFLVGGFPCQAFSIAGQRRGFNDTRGTLFFEIARILDAKQPKYFLLENVKGLLSHDGGRTFATIISTLDELGYDIQWQVLNSKDFGVPQSRERIFIVGNLRGEPRPEVFPFRFNDEVGAETDQDEAGRQIALTLTGRSASGTNARGNYIVHNLYGGFDEGIREFHEYSPTIRTARGGGHLPSVVQGMRVRRLTPIECERLQGFPDNWTAGISDTQRYKCLGNAVTVNVIKEIVKKLI